jgi:small subunit ribosomal protein S16
VAIVSIERVAAKCAQTSRRFVRHHAHVRHAQPVEEEHFRVVKLRLRRMGAKKRPSYRIVAADSRSPRDGAFIESVGFYDPITDPATINVNLERARHWLSVGAQPTETVRSLLKKAGVYRVEAAE